METKLENLNCKTMSSLEIAELTGKQHNDVLKAIRAMEPAWIKITEGKFSLSEYKDSTGRKLPCYYLTKTECLYIATKFNDEARAKLIIRWENLETGKEQPMYQLPNFNNPAEAARAWANQYENNIQLTNKNEKLAKEVTTLRPKAELMDKVIDSDQKIDIGQTAKILGLPFGRNKLFKILREKGIFFKDRNEPKQEYVDRKYFVLKEKWIDRNEHEGFMIVKVLVTQKGLAFINTLF